jgi:hypothetical protein
MEPNAEVGGSDGVDGSRDLSCSSIAFSRSMSSSAESSATACCATSARACKHQRGETA